MNHRWVPGVTGLVVGVAFLCSCAGGSSSGPSEGVRSAYTEAMEALLSQGADAAEAVLNTTTAEPGNASDTALMMVGRSRVLSARGNHAEALKTLQEATEIAPDLGDAHYFLSLAYFNGFLSEESLASAERAVELDPENADYLYQAAQMYDRTGRVEQTEETWERLLSTHPDEPRYLVPLAGLHHRLGDTGRAIELLDRAAAAAPDQQMGQMAQQLAVQLRGETETSSEIARLETALKFAPQDPRLHHRRAELMFGAGDLVRAETAIRNAISLESGAAEHTHLLARILDGKGDKEGAAAAMQQAVEIDPDNVDYTLSLAGLRMQLGDLSGARAMLERVIEMAPDSEQANFAREQLEKIQEAR